MNTLYPLSRRDILKKSLLGLLVVSPLAQFLSAVPAEGYEPCQCTRERLIHAWCEGPDFYYTILSYDCYNPSIECSTDTYVRPNSPGCDQDDDGEYTYGYDPDGDGDMVGC